MSSLSPSVILSIVVAGQGGEKTPRRRGKGEKEDDGKLYTLSLINLGSVRYVIASSMRKGGRRRKGGGKKKKKSFSIISLLSGRRVSFGERVKGRGGKEGRGEKGFRFCPLSLVFVVRVHDALEAGREAQGEGKGEEEEGKNLSSLLSVSLRGDDEDQRRGGGGRGGKGKGERRLAYSTLSLLISVEGEENSERKGGGGGRESVLFYLLCASPPGDASDGLRGAGRG